MTHIPNASRRSFLSGFPAGLTIVAALLAVPAIASGYPISCKTQAEMKDADRASIVTAARTIASRMQANDANAVKAMTIASVAGNFDSIASTIQGLAPLMTGAELSVTAVYDLNAADAKPDQDEVEFFCGVAANAAHVTFTIPQLPPGHYAFAVVEATGVKTPQRLALLLQQTGTWQLAGFFPRPLLEDGHDGVWYWQRARAFAKSNQPWNAFFYYQAAATLLVPADFVGSNNLDKLIQEQTAATPTGLPGAQPMIVNVQGIPVTITDLHTDASLGGFDLVVGYNAADVSDPVATRTKTVALMKSLLLQHPEWKDGFHGLWVFANAPNQHPFSLELPMAEIPNQS